MYGSTAFHRIPIARFWQHMISAHYIRFQRIAEIFKYYIRKVLTTN
jgi:hypothetical protein